MGLHSWHITVSLIAVVGCGEGYHCLKKSCMHKFLTKINKSGYCLVEVYCSFCPVTASVVVSDVCGFQFVY